MQTSVHGKYTGMHQGRSMITQHKVTELYRNLKLELNSFFVNHKNDKIVLATLLSMNKV